MRAASEHARDRQEDRPGRVDRQSGDRSGQMVRVQRKRGVPPLPAETPQDGRVDRGAVLFRADRATQGQPEEAQVEEAAAHGRRASACLRAGRAAERLEPGADRGPAWIGNGVLDRFLEDESLFGEFLRTPVSEGGVEPLVVGPPHVVVEVGA